MQEVRTIEDYDTLCQRKEQLRYALGVEKAAEIEACPELFVDAEKFRKFHAKARFRSIATSALVVAGGSTLAAQQLGLPNGRALIRAHPYPTLAVGVGTLLVSYQFWHYVAGFRSNEYNELKYSRYIRMLRNA